MTQPSRLYRLIEGELQRAQPGATLLGYVTERRATTSWDKIAFELSTIANTQLSGETLRLWFADRIQVEDRAVA